MVMQHRILHRAAEARGEPPGQPVLDRGDHGLRAEGGGVVITLPLKPGLGLQTLLVASH
jgi:hypothetical protein